MPECKGVQSTERAGTTRYFDQGGRSVCWLWQSRKHCSVRPQPRWLLCWLPDRLPAVQGYGALSACERSVKDRVGACMHRTLPKQTQAYPPCLYTLLGTRSRLVGDSSHVAGSQPGGSCRAPGRQTEGDDDSSSLNDAAGGCISGLRGRQGS